MNTAQNSGLKLYNELADWWPLLSAPADYQPEAEFFHQTLLAFCDPPPRTVLELGAGGGNNASHLKAHYRLTLVDLSPAMSAVSRRLNPECEHLTGDMRSVRLGRQFDAVFIHDAIMYLTTAEDLQQALVTAFVHCRPGGVAVFVPDFVRETFTSTTDHGGHDGAERGVRYLQWTTDPDPADSTYETHFVYLLREGRQPAQVKQERHLFGLFRREDWLNWLGEAGFTSRAVQDTFGRYVFVGCKPPL